jgi:hypothetical protein
LLAAAVEAVVPQDPGKAVFFNTSGDFINSVTVGSLPDMLTFTPDGDRVLVANEGEPNNAYQLDPNAFPNGDELKLPENLVRLTVTNTLGDSNGDGLFEQIYAFGGRSFSILEWDETTISCQNHFEGLRDPRLLKEVGDLRLFGLYLFNFLNLN